jgi:hypothetical protein
MLVVAGDCHLQSGLATFIGLVLPEQPGALLRIGVVDRAISARASRKGTQVSDQRLRSRLTFVTPIRAGFLQKGFTLVVEIGGNSVEFSSS